MPHKNWAAAILAFACGIVLAAMCFQNYVHHRVTFGSARRPRNGPQLIFKGRDNLERARAFAFDDLYRNYASDLCQHTITSGEREEVVLQVKQKLLTYNGNQSLLYQQAGYDYDDYLDECASRATDEAIALFLKV